MSEEDEPPRQGQTIRWEGEMWYVAVREERGERVRLRLVSVESPRRKVDVFHHVSAPLRHYI